MKKGKKKRNIVQLSPDSFIALVIQKQSNIRETFMQKKRKKLKCVATVLP